MQERRLSADRFGAFSDAVIAVIITVMVLELKVPDGSRFADLLPLWPTAISYAASYLFIAVIWVNHHHLLHLVQQPTPRLIWLNLVHLFAVSLLPFATAWVARSHMAAAPVVVYAVIFLLIDLAYLAARCSRCWCSRPAPPSLLSCRCSASPPCAVRCYFISGPRRSAGLSGRPNPNLQNSPLHHDQKE
ncbi:DUF1211 domain-containing protein [Bradyrhizobium quebecense]|uniref:TMEM175 family protein n=1 Tax=Bradyrhizobium quebecense TaxID=2748629 RepID=UPI001CD376D2|nr:TMEM175 family protein [Bradyrhizobium quebecense]UGA43897.1 DUF1211 domain-containing protein [Bradyrhizobium quebecense]